MGPRQTDAMQPWKTNLERNFEPKIEDPTYSTEEAHQYVYMYVFVSVCLWVSFLCYFVGPPARL